jgi:ATP synthase protein I
MTEDGRKRDRAKLDALGAQIEERKAREAAKTARKMPQETASALGLAWRLSTEIVATLVVGGLLGYAADYLLESAPWGLLIGLMFGFAAGLRNVIRLTAKMQESMNPKP